MPVTDDEKMTGERALKMADAERIEAELIGLDRGTDPFVAAVRATRMPMIITDPRQPDNPVVFANESFCRLTGYERSEILGRNCRFLQGAETDPQTIRRIHDAVERVEAIEIDIRNHRKDGSAFWNRLLMAPVYDAYGKHAYFFASQVDVTIERERLEGLESDNAAMLAELSHRAHVELQRDRELDLAMRAGGFGAWSMDLGTRAIVASDVYKSILGWPLDHPMTYDNRLASVHPDDRAAVAAQIQAGIDGDADYKIQHRVITPAGETRWVASRGLTIFDTSGTPVRIAGVTTDVTAQVRSERMRAAMIELSDVIRDLDDPTDIAYAAAEIIGRTLDVSRAGYGIVDPVAETITIERDWNAPGITTIAGVLNFREHGSYIDDLKRGESAIITDTRTDPRTSATSPVLEAISARAFINMPVTEQGGFVALLYLNHAEPRQWPDDELAFIRDVAERTRAATERRRAEQELQLLAASLELQVEERTAALMEAEAALRQSQKMEAVGQLTGGIAHDFNNLLTGITGSLELLAKRVAEGRASEVDKFVNAAQGAARRAASLTHRLLAFSRRQTLEPKPTDVMRLARGMEDLIQRTVGPAINVESVHAAGVWPVLVDPGQLENALLNLCINARDAMPDGGKLTIETGNRWLDHRSAAERELPAGQYVSICVSDTGHGMSASVIAKAFEPFFTTKPIGEGTGLGLSMIYGFVKQSGGQVRIYSELGEGAMVCLYLPRYLGDLNLSEEPSDAGEAPRAQAHETVLVVDDEPTVRMLASEVLTELGYTSIEVDDGPAGLGVLNSDRRIDLLITDVGLPGGMNGRQVADAARVLRPELKVLFITGYAENAVLSHGHLDPGMQILTKPFSMDELAHRIKAILLGD
ncbi:PAS domain-containing protein [Novosphingobium sp. AP12]|uniref:PAS domain-containing protein n=1 Tax=Novosphingobium sp. AP12 TaxID=1144305 RepID=UPI000271E1DD|nr:PAS domain-containing protein [Novosphingobium sp. AP12]EJL35389.1 PAS domain S-box [Novosphingobium sp. AP12]